MATLLVTENVAPSSSSFEISPTTNDDTIPLIVDTCIQNNKTIDEKIDFVVEEALECTAVISPSATTLVTSATTGDESDTKTNLQETVPQSYLLSLNDGPTDHQVHVNYIATQSETTHEQKVKTYRRSKSTVNLPSNSSSQKSNDCQAKGANLLDATINVTTKAAGATLSPSNNNNLTGWLVSGNETYSCDVGNTIQAITTIAFPGSQDFSTTKGPENDDETSSVGSSSSVAYFDPSDFDSSTWRNVVWNHASTTAVGIVTVVALATTAIAHPLFFLAASAIAAVGTVTAAITHRDSAPSALSSTDVEAEVNGKNEVDEKTIDTSSITSATESSWSAWLCFDNPFQTGNDDVPKSINHTETVEHLPESTIAAIDDPVSVSRSNTELPSVIRCKLPKDDQASWVLKHFPRLSNRVGPSRIGGNSNSTSSSATLVGLNSIDCFRVFFDDSAPYNFLALQEKRGDLHIQYGLWSKLPMTGKISLFDHKHSVTFPNDISMHSYQGRLLTFHAKTNAMFGPPYAKTTKIQKFLLVNRRLAILENKTTLSGIPFSDRFFVGERWIFAAEKVNNRYVTHVHVDCEVFFHQGSCPFEQQIKSKSVSTINEVVSSWCTMAVEALKLTERAKLDRLQRTMDDDPDDDETVDDIQTEENIESLTTHNLNDDDAIEVVADASLLLTKDSATTNHRPRSTLRGIKHFGRRRHSFDDECVVAN